MEGYAAELQSAVRGEGRTKDDRDAVFMSRALLLARRGMGRVSPNPMVGCLLVRDGEVVGEGYHEQFGGPHAEVSALAAAGEMTRDSTAYLTLEPCAEDFPDKKTPPCVPALIDAGITRVVIATADPNPRVAGRGIHRLRAAGIEVIEEVLGEKARRLNRGYFEWVTTGRPYVILKAAQTRDGYVRARLRGEAWFTGPEARRHVHQLRAEVDAVMIGRRTAERDNPRLTVREVPGVNPRRVVLDSRLVLPPDLHLFRDGAAPTLVFTEEGESARMDWGERIKVAASPQGVDLPAVLAVLGARGVTNLLVEGGPALHRRFLEARLANEVVLFTAPAQADPEVRQRPGLRNVVEALEGWRVVEQRDLGPDRLIVAQSSRRS